MKNITLIGMPACGKSTVGILLAKVLGYQFFDCDILIQQQEEKLLHEIIEEQGLEAFIEIENQINANIDTNRAVLSPGGSVVYGEEAMAHLREISTVVYLKLPYETIEERIGNIKRRGVVLRNGETLEDLFAERTPLYEQYAHFTIEADGLSVEDLLDTTVLALAYFSKYDEILEIEQNSLQTGPYLLK